MRRKFIYNFFQIYLHKLINSIIFRYKIGYKTAPEVHHVYLSPPPASVKYVEYVDKPIFIERIIERSAPVFKPVHVEYKDASSYG